ncbi:MAG: metal-dependent hydrolase, partial [Mycobacterium sp.]
MMRPRRLEREYDPGPVQIQARKVHFDASGIPLHWIPHHPVASNFVSLLNVVLPPIERYFVAVFNEALPLVKDAKLAEDMRGFIGLEATHADVHNQV